MKLLNITSTRKKTAHFYKWLAKKLHIQGLRSLKMRSLLSVNDEFSDKHNAENGVFLQPLTNHAGKNVLKSLALALLLLNNSSSVFAQEWKASAKDSILKYRTVPLAIKINDKNGIAAKGVEVHVQMQKHYFKWGTTININEISKILGNYGTFNANSKYLNHFRLFNSVTPENAGKWKGWIDPPQRATYLKTVKWLESEGIANRGHTCVWESERFNAIPDILIGQSDTAVIRSLVKSHINSVMHTLGDDLYEIDVVNELIHEQHIVKGLLHVDDAALEHSKWYKWAKQAAPKTKLIANEFDLFQSGNDFYQRYISYVRKMIEDGAPVYGVGMQGHFWSAMPNYNELKRRIEQVKTLGLPMAVTEFDMVGKSYSDMERVLYSVFSEPQIYGFTMWGAWDGSQWRNNGPLFEDNWELKPSGEAWLDLVHEKWKTDTTIITSASETMKLTAFKGDYLITLKHNGKVFTDKVTCVHDSLELIYNIDSIHTSIPEVTLSTQNEQGEYNVYQPAVLKVASNMPESIAKVEFYQGLFMEYRDTIPGFRYEFVSTAATSKSIYARVFLKNGYSITTDTVHLSFINANAFPTIQSVYPYLNQSFIKGDDIDVYCDVHDYEEQMWKVELSGFSNDSILTDTIPPYHFSLTDLEPNTYQVELKAIDSLHGFGTKSLTFKILDPDESALDLSQPAAPTELLISGKTNTNLNLKWNAPEDEDIICFFTYIDGEKYTPYGTTQTYSEIKLPNLDVRSIYVTAMNQYSLESNPSNTILSNDQVTSISQEHSEDQIIAFPNPFSERVKVVSIGNIDLVKNIDIYNSVGQLINSLKPIQLNNNRVLEYIWDGKSSHGNSMPPGIYYLNQGSLNHKLIKQ